MKNLLETCRVIVCTGSGGVGKTTTSAALGVAAARMGRRVLVLTIDPARRLATSLGLADCSDDTLVPCDVGSGALYAGMIDPGRVFTEYIERYSRDRGAAQRLFDNRLYQQLATTLSGSQEFTSLSRLYEATSCGKYDLVILDTPPAAHESDILRAPDRLNAVFDSHVVSIFMGRTAGLGLVAGAWKQGMKMLLGTLTFLTGSEFVATFKDFFTAIDAIAPNILETNTKARELLRDRSTAFVLITSFDEAKIQEGEAFHFELKSSGYHLRKVIFNRAWPHWFQLSASSQIKIQKSLLAKGAVELASWHEKLLAYYTHRRAVQIKFDDYIAIPEMDNEVVGMAALGELADLLVADPAHEKMSPAEDRPAIY